jgi:cytochrome c5
MSDHDSNHAPSKGPAIAAIIGLFGAVAVMVSLFMPQTETAPAAVAASAPMDATKVAENIKPVATVEVAEAAGMKVSLSGEQVVKNGCAMCHAAGLMNAPKIGDKGQWGPRLTQGYETLVKHATEGIRAMPARGGNPALTDLEMARAVAHMANLSGADFKEPAENAAAPTAEPAKAS